MNSEILFEKLGYKKIEVNNFGLNLVKYYNDDLDIIIFYLNNKVFEKTHEHSNNYNYEIKPITMQELEAINQKVKELNWETK